MGQSTGAPSEEAHLTSLNPDCTLSLSPEPIFLYEFYPHTPGLTQLIKLGPGILDLHRVRASIRKQR